MNRFKPVLVTGGSQGIGSATVRMLVAEKCPVVFTYRHNAASAAALVDEIGDSQIVRAIGCDISDEHQVTELFATLDAEHGGLSGLVNNAAQNAKVNSKLADAEISDIAELIHTNILGTIQVTQQAIRRMSTNNGGDGGSIVMVSSRASKLGAAGAQVWYAASKGAIDSLTIGLARELATEGIRVNAVSPGPIDSNDRPDQLERLQLLANTIPMGRVGKPPEVAAAIRWLISDEASFVTGATIAVSGGR